MSFHDPLYPRTGRFNQYVDTRVQVDRSSSDESQGPPAKRQRTLSPKTEVQVVPKTEPQEVLTHHTSNVGSSSMHTNQVLAYSIQNHINKAVEWFYVFAYEWFNKRSAWYGGRGEPMGPGCIPQYTDGTCSSKTYLSREDIVYHMKSELSDGEETSKEDVKNWTKSLLESFQFKHICPSCSGLFKSTEHFEEHLIKVNKTQIKCPYNCGKNLVSFRNLLRHLDSAHKLNRGKLGQDGEFKCKYPGCEKAFPTSTGLRVHAISKHDLEARTCRICKRDFDNKAMMITHLLAAHGLIYGEDKECVCNQKGCGKRFATKRGLDQHKALSHKQFNPSADDYHRCTEKNCGRLFKTVEGLMNHLEKTHWR